MATIQVENALRYLAEVGSLPLEVLPMYLSAKYHNERYIMRVAWAQGTGFNFYETNEPKDPKAPKSKATLPTWEEWNDPDYWEEKALENAAKDQIKTVDDFIGMLKVRIR